MFKLVSRKSISVTPKKSLLNPTAIKRAFSVQYPLFNSSSNDGEHKPAPQPSQASHTHTHNGQPCGGHSHSHASQPLKDQNGNPVKIDKPMLMLAFTCKKCDTRSSHVLSKQAYTHGSVLVQCPGCKNRHLVSDHLKIFSDHKITLEEIMRAQGEAVRSNVDDLVFEDIPDSLKALIGHHAKNAPAEYQKKGDSTEAPPALKSGDEK